MQTAQQADYRRQAMHRLPLHVFRSGTSRGALFLERDLLAVPSSSSSLEKTCVEDGGGPEDASSRLERLCARVVVSGHPYAVDGVGGGRSSTMKSLYIRESALPDCDVECRFVQSRVESFGVDLSHGDCGNMAASIGPFAIERGLVAPSSGENSTSVRVLSMNTGTRYKIRCETTDDGAVRYAGTATISGVEGHAAPVSVIAENPAGSVLGRLLPTDTTVDVVPLGGKQVQVSCVDFVRPMVLFLAEDLGMTGAETKAECDANEDLMARVEVLRQKAALIMGMGDVTNAASPKIAALSPPKAAPAGGGAIEVGVRYFTEPFNCDLHYAIALTAAQCIGAAATIPGTLAAPVEGGGEGEGRSANGGEVEVVLRHPSGATSVYITLGAKDGMPTSSRYVRTVRPIVQGHAFYPIV